MNLEFSKRYLMKVNFKKFAFQIFAKSSCWSLSE